MKRRTRLVVIIGGITVAMLGAGVAWVGHRLQYDSGPYARLLGKNWDSSGDPVAVNTAVFLGGAPIMDRHHVALRILSVRPTNLPKGIRLLGARGMPAPPELGIGPMTWVHQVQRHSLYRLPGAVFYHDEEPALIAEPVRPGRYVIEGLLVTYQWGQKRYTDYARTQFVLCAYRTASQAKQRGCSINVPPPPSVWP